MDDLDQNTKRAEKAPSVTSHNDLITASYYLPLIEERIILYAISKVNPRTHKPQSKAVRIDAQEWARAFEMTPDSAYRFLQTSIDNLYERSVTISSGETETAFRWLQSKHYEKGGGWGEVMFSDRIWKYITKLAGDHTRIPLEHFALLKSPYTIRLYRMIQKWKNKGQLFITVDDFRKRLLLEKKYPRFVDLKRRIIEPSVKEIRSKSQFNIDWDVKRKGRAVKSLIFTFSQKQEGFDFD